MLFNSINYMIFFPIVTLLYFLLPVKARNLWLLMTSYFFYMCWNAEYAILILFSTVATYGSGLLLGRVQEDARKKRKCIVAICVSVNLAILVFFKYSNMALEMAEYLFAKLHIEMSLPRLDILLPVGISFYTFQALGYIVDVYRGTIHAERNFIRYALFVSFFPQLVAGPIERSGNLLRQFREKVVFNAERALNGILLMLWGLFLKMVIADRITIFVDRVYLYHDVHDGMYIIVATVLFAFQLYCDFYGYSVIAIGSAKVLGIELMQNFKTPYLSRSVSEFWSRWHISLCTWFRDYLYIPLGGNRKGTIRTYINKMIVFLTSGLWHGANLTYVVWGGLNGLYQVIAEMVHKLWRHKAERHIAVETNGTSTRGKHLRNLLGILSTFVLWDFSLLFFRAPDIKTACRMLVEATHLGNAAEFFQTAGVIPCGLALPEIIVLLCAILLLVCVECMNDQGIVVREKVMRAPIVLRSLLIAIAVAVILLFGIYGAGFDSAAFIYFQF